jgi:hypothetical protein
MTGRSATQSCLRRGFGPAAKIRAEWGHSSDVAWSPRLGLGLSDANSAVCLRWGIFGISFFRTIRSDRWRRAIPLHPPSGWWVRTASGYGTQRRKPAHCRRAHEFYRGRICSCTGPGCRSYESGNLALRIAAALDYSEASVFTRAFRRWSGRSPNDWRRLKQHIAGDRKYASR